MHKIFLPLIILGIMLLSILPGKGQITITADNFPRAAAFVDTIYRSAPSAFVVPAEGPDQIWDYSNLAMEELIQIEHFDASVYPQFPDALNVRINDLIFQGFLILSDSYEAVDAEGWYDIGRSTYDASYSITAITGGPNDTLSFPGTDQEFGGRINYVQFPMTFGDQYTQSRIENIPYELTVAAFGLDKTPGVRQRIVTQERDIVGHGKLTLAYANGSPTLPMDVLMVKRIETKLDSVFLGGAPAPPALLQAFGLIQGASVTETSYVFYTTDFAAPVLSYDIGNDFAFYRPQGAPLLSATYNLIPTVVNSFPNPLRAGGILNIKTSQKLKTGTIQFMDVMGRIAFHLDYNTYEDSNLQVGIPSSIAAGFYSYNVLDEKGIPVAMGKVIID